MQLGDTDFSLTPPKPGYTQTPAATAPPPVPIGQNSSAKDLAQNTFTGVFIIDGVVAETSFVTINFT